MKRSSMNSSGVEAMATKKSLTAAAQAVTDQFFTTKEDQQESTNKAAQAAQEGRQEVRAGKSSIEWKAAEKAAKTAKKAADPVKVFSFRAAVHDVDQWRLYAAIRGEKVDEIGAAAMREYLKKHPLSAEEKALFDKRLESMKT